MSLEGIIASPWPAPVVKQLDAWQQGDVVAVSKQVPWMAPGGTDVITGKTSAGNAGSLVMTSVALAPLGLGVITSQTCDVIGVGQGAKHPTVQVSPIVRVTDAGTMADLAANKLVSHVRVTEPTVCGSDVWAVDLRINFPISKALLLTQKRESAFVNEADALAFAERLAMKAGRSSFHDVISSDLAAALRDIIVSMRDAGTWTNDVEQFRIGIEEGTRLVPRRFFLLVLTDESPGPTVTKAFADGVKAWARANRRQHRRLGIHVSEARVRDVSEVGIVNYRNTTYLSVPELGRPYYP